MNRFQVETSDVMDKAIDRLMARVGLRTKKELFENALSLMSWAVREVERGRVIASVDEKNERYSELQMPFLQHVVETRNDRHAAAAMQAE